MPETRKMQRPVSHARDAEHYGEHWSARAECNGEDTEIFYSSYLDDTYAALELCKVCPVKKECLAEDDGWGIRGGKTEEARLAERRAARLNKEPAPNARSNATTCKSGHPFSPENTGKDREGIRMCLTCFDARETRRAEKRRNNRISQRQEISA